MSKNIIFDIGIEHEFFLLKYPDYTGKMLVLNANHEMQKVFGYSIDQNSSVSDDYPTIGLPKNLFGANVDYHDLVTDGTAMEYRCFKRMRNSHDLDGFISYYELFNLPFLKHYQNHSQFQRSFYKKGGNVSFENAGKRFASWKWMRDANKKVSFQAEKKDDGEDVSLRTSGTHIHFSFNDNFTKEQRDILNRDVFITNTYVHTDALVNIFDEIYRDIFHQGSDVIARREEYQNFGVYRIKNSNNITGNPSLEYRQLASSEVNGKYHSEGACLKHFITLCQYRAKEYLSKHFDFLK